jgi:hypothetical protein
VKGGRQRLPSAANRGARHLTGCVAHRLHGAWPFHRFLEPVFRALVFLLLLFRPLDFREARAPAVFPAALFRAPPLAAPAAAPAVRRSSLRGALRTRTTMTISPSGPRTSPCIFAALRMFL